MEAPVIQWPGMIILEGNHHRQLNSISFCCAQDLDCLLIYLDKM